LAVKLKLEINPAISIETKPITASLTCVVVDDFLLNPHELIDYAVRHKDDFENAGVLPRT
jgi:hypothetical protein